MSKERELIKKSLKELLSDNISGMKKSIKSALFHKVKKKVAERKEEMAKELVSKK